MGTSSAELIADPAIQDTLSVYLVDQLYANVDVAGALEERLPNNLKGLAAPLAGALREPTTRTVNRLLAAPRVQQLWVTANGEAHQKLINVLENKTGNGIDTGDGAVRSTCASSWPSSESTSASRPPALNEVCPRMPEW